LYSFLFYLFIFVVILQVGYYGFLFSKFSRVKNKHTHSKTYPISVIISCKNEAENLIKNLPKLLIQDYPSFEIIVVDDASTDETLSVLHSFETKNEILTILSIPKTASYNGNKKNALEKAIEIAQYEHLLFTDADCIPVSTSWITKMTTQFSDQKQLVLGYGSYEKKSGWLNKIIRYETLLTAWQYFSFAIIGKPFMGVGRNIAYTKSLFYQQNGFENHKNIRSGDDDLFVNEAATANNIGICWQQKSHTLSTPKTRLTEWIKQKRRHITTATSYKPMHQFLLGLFYISQLLFYGLLVVLLFNVNYIKFVLLLASLRFICYFISLIPTANKLKENDLIKYAAFLELFLIVLQLRIFISNLWKKPATW